MNVSVSNVYIGVLGVYVVLQKPNKADGICKQGAKCFGHRGVDFKWFR